MSRRPDRHLPLLILSLGGNSDGARDGRRERIDFVEKHAFAR